MVCAGRSVVVGGQAVPEGCVCGVSVDATAVVRGYRHRLVAHGWAGVCVVQAGKYWSVRLARKSWFR